MCSFKIPLFLFSWQLRYCTASDVFILFIFSLSFIISALFIFLDFQSFDCLYFLHVCHLLWLRYYHIYGMLIQFMRFFLFLLLNWVEISIVIKYNKSKRKHIPFFLFLLNYKKYFIYIFIISFYCGKNNKNILIKYISKNETIILFYIPVTYIYYFIIFLIY